MQGFLNATNFIFGQNRTECYFDLDDMVLHGRVGSRVLTHNWFNWFDFLASVDQFIYIPFMVHALIDECYYGALEIVDLSLEYVQFASTPDIVLFNLVYNIGDIYNSLRNIVFYFFENNCQSSRLTFSD